MPKQHYMRVHLHNYLFAKSPRRLARRFTAGCSLALLFQFHSQASLFKTSLVLFLSSAWSFVRLPHLYPLGFMAIAAILFSYAFFLRSTGSSPLTLSFSFFSSASIVSFEIFKNSSQLQQVVIESCFKPLIRDQMLKRVVVFFFIHSYDLSPWSIETLTFK